MSKRPAAITLPRKYRKSFTGCWTCRNRKIKCDEAKPKCGQCRHKDLACGYGVKLQWVGSADVPDQDGLLQTRSQRCQMKPDSNRPVIPNGKITEILDALDAVDNKDVASLADEISLSINSFGVFSMKPSPQISTRGSPNDTDRDCSELLQHNMDESVQPPQSQLWDLPTPSSLTGGDDELMLNQTLLDPFSNQLATSICDSGSLVDPLYMELGDSDDIVGSLDENNDSYTPSSEIISSTVTQNGSIYESFLMNYYAHRVIQKFCVLDSAKNPWKIIHLPMALQSVGEMSVRGTTSRIRRALINTVLSIAAFHLSSDAKFRPQNEEIAKWNAMAMSCHEKAVRLLKEAVQIDFYYESRPKYKEFLATMLSMVMANTLAGDVAACGLHLTGAFHIINESKIWKSNYSTKAKSLHHVYFYSRAIYESTAPLGHHSTRRAYSPTQKTQEHHATLNEILCHELARDKNMESSLEFTAGSGMSSYESIYGVPYSLFALLARCIELITSLYHDGAPRPGSTIPDHLAGEFDELERNIMDWSLEAELKHCLPAWLCKTSGIIQHQTRAFHNALIIYFAQHVRLVSHRFLLPYVKSILESLQAIDRIQTDGQTFSATLYWPVFIAGSEAFDEDVQTQFRYWYSQAEHCGISRARTGINVLEEVWRMGPVAGSRTACYWRSVMDQSNYSLMLC